MSITIRLTRTGRKNLPSFRIVVAQTKDKRDGKFLEIVGHYNPSEKSAKPVFDKERIEYWKKNGALVSESVQEIMDGKYVFVPYKKVKSGEQEVKKEEIKEAPAEEKASE